MALATAFQKGKVNVINATSHSSLLSAGRLQQLSNASRRSREPTHQNTYLFSFYHRAGMVHKVALGVTFRPVAIWRTGDSLFYDQAQVIVNTKSSTEIDLIPRGQVFISSLRSKAEPSESNDMRCGREIWNGRKMREKSEFYKKHVWAVVFHLFFAHGKTFSKIQDWEDHRHFAAIIIFFLPDGGLTNLASSLMLFHARETFVLVLVKESNICFFMLLIHTNILEVTSLPS